jgi:hypothetical protein
MNWAEQEMKLFRLYFYTFWMLVVLAVWVGTSLAGGIYKYAAGKCDAEWFWEPMVRTDVMCWIE